MISYGVEPFGEEIEAAFARLLEDGGGESAKRRWQYQANPHGPAWFAVGRDPEADGAIVGLIALIATRFRIAGEGVLGYQAVDTIVDPAYRGRNIFVGMGKAGHGGGDVHGGKALWGFPNANAARGWFGRLGWRNFGAIPFLVKPLRSGYFLRRVAGPLGAFNLPIARRRRAADPRYQAIGRFDDQATALWRACAERVGCGVDRDADFLNWRLMDRPGSVYRTTGLRDPAGRLKAFVSTALLDKHGGRVAYVMEAMAAPEDARELAALLRHEIARRAAEGADVAFAWCPPTAWNRPIYKAARFLPLPERLRPIAIHFGARPIAADAPAAIGDADAWFISYLDSDTV